MRLVVRRLGIALCAVAIVGCGRKSPPENAPAPAAGSPPTTSQAKTYEQVLQEVGDGDDSYMKMSLAAAGYLRHIVPGKSIGILQPNMASPGFQEMVDAVTHAYAFRPVPSTEYGVNCADPSSNSRTVTTAGPVCTMKLAEVVVALLLTRMSRDSGYVGGSVAQVPRGAAQAEVKQFCITLAQHGTEWVAIRHTFVTVARSCPR